MNIAIFGGSFDPFHIGHEKIIDLCLQILPIEKLFIVPTFLNPFKNKSYFDANTRLELIQDLYKNNKNIQIIDYEVKQNKKIPTYETIQFLKKQYNIEKIFLIIGADNLKDVHLWYNFKNLKELVQFVVISRDGIKLQNQYIKPIYIELNENISSTSLRETRELKYIPKKIQHKVKKLWKIE
jgi:nicotinate-nucleotide adenylyltransferase